MPRYISLFCTVAAAFTAFTAGPASAQNQDDLPAVRVLVSDLDLTSPRGQILLDLRIRSAAAKVCNGPIETPLFPDRCFSEAMQRARTQRDRLLGRQQAASIGGNAGSSTPRPDRQVASYTCDHRSNSLVCSKAAHGIRPASDN